MEIDLESDSIQTSYQYVDSKIYIRIRSNSTRKRKRATYKTDITER